ncbi:MAG: hypothetical protein WAL40_19005 [Rhodoplanes sp.]
MVNCKIGDEGKFNWAPPRKRAAEILGENETLLWEIASDMEPEDGCLWIYDTDDQQTVAFTPTGMEYLQEMLAEYKRDRSSPRS